MKVASLRSSPDHPKPKRKQVLNVSLEVYNYIASQGKFGDTVDSVLRRLFGLPSKPTHGNESDLGDPNGS